MSDHTTRKSSEVKLCSKCKESKPLVEFNRKSDNPDGMDYWCKACKAEAARVYYAANRDRQLEASRAWRQANPERKAKINRAWIVANRERKAETDRAYQKSNPEKRAKNEARNRARHPDRIAARGAVGSAVAMGKIPPARDLPCSTCGEPAEQYHHYKGYAPEHKLDVIPVCVTCHAEFHRTEEP